MKEKIILTITLILLALVIIFFLVVLQPFSLSGKAIETQYSFTKAICNSSGYCQDNIYVCLGSKTLSISPITGSEIQLPEGREIYISNKTC